MNGMRSPKYITRVIRRKGPGKPGWQVRLPVGLGMRFFRDDRYGGSDKAYSQAKWWRNTILIERRMEWLLKNNVRSNVGRPRKHWPRYAHTPKAGNSRGTIESE